MVFNAGLRWARQSANNFIQMISNAYYCFTKERLPAAEVVANRCQQRR